MELDTTTQAPTDQNETTIGNTVPVTFITIGNKTVDGKVDTGATTSSLHAENISVDKNGGQVSFVCPALSPNRISMPLAGTQDVHSADGGGQARPTVQLDVKISGKTVRALFNLNDRSNMDVMVLVGQNILKAGSFIIDVKKDETNESTAVIPTISVDDAIKIIAESDLSLDDFVKKLYAERANIEHKGLIR